MPRTLTIAVIEPYYGGSHAAFVDTFMQHSRHRCRLFKMPARKWKWRMRGAAIWFAEELTSDNASSVGRPDVILCSDMLSVADLRALLPSPLRNTPIVCYFHENQLTYPFSHESERDFHFGMTNISSCLAADAVWFNSQYHLTGFLHESSRMLAAMPDYVPSDIPKSILAKSRVSPPPIDAPNHRRRRETPPVKPVILWCHRWEYDKNPDLFFNTLAELLTRGHDFELVVTGESFRTVPKAFAAVSGGLASRVTHAGFIPDRGQYLEMLSRCDIVVSTAVQENFGIAVVESILSGCQPLLPNRLVYPEILPADVHDCCLYNTDTELLQRLESLCTGGSWLSDGRQNTLQADLEHRFGVAAVVAAMDDELEQLAVELRQRS